MIQTFLPARENPLAVNLTSNIEFRFSDHDWEFHLERLRKMNFRAAIVGQQGSGKSTLLRELTLQLRQRSIENHFVFLPQALRQALPQARQQHQLMLDQAFEHSEKGCVLLVDGIERLNFFQRRDLLKRTRNSAGLVITKHHRCKLPTWVQTQTSPALMTQVLVDLKLDHPAFLSAGEAAFAKHGGNIRNALRDLYDQCAAGGFNEILSR